MNFYGYRRPDGLVGIRSHVLILPTVGCANETCRIIAGLVNGAVSLVNQNGCGEVDGNRKLTQDVLGGLAANPNVYGTIMVGLGCEPNSVCDMAEIIRAKTNKPLQSVVIQEEGGTVNAICKAVKLARIWSLKHLPAVRRSSMFQSSCWALSAADPMLHRVLSPILSWAASATGW